MPGNPSGPFTMTGDHDDPIMAEGNSNTCWSIAGGRNEVGQRPAVELVTLALPRPALGAIDHGKGELITFASPDGVQRLSTITNYFRAH
jgi:hypothetical protein